MVDRRTFEPLLKQIGADGAGRSAVIEILRRRAIVDGEHAAGFPGWQPLSQIFVVGVVDLDPLADRMAFEKPGGLGQLGGGKQGFMGVFVEMNGKFLPACGGFLKPTDRERVHQFIGINNGVATTRREGVQGGAVPDGAPT